MAHRLYIVDVFAERRYAGNQLAVVIVDEPLSDETMQLIAAEMWFSETTFLSPRPERDGTYRVRIFTPAQELAFAGHPILGTAWVLRRHLGLDATAVIRLNLAVGEVAVRFEVAAADDRELAWFCAPAMTLGPTAEPEAMAAALGLSTEDIAADAPIRQVSAGTAAVIVPLRSLDALRRSRLDLDAYAPLANQGFPPQVYLFCRQTHHRNNDLCARFFFDAHGVREDAATGNGAAFLGAYLLQHPLISTAGLTIRIEQGHEVRRPSLVLLRAALVDGVPDIHVGGSIVATARGELL